MSANGHPVPTDGAPELSVVIALIAGGQEATSSCLTALARSARPEQAQTVDLMD